MDMVYFRSFDRLLTVAKSKHVFFMKLSMIQRLKKQITSDNSESQLETKNFWRKKSCL